jgi:hypothetical protein
MGHLVVLAHPQDRHDVVRVGTSFPLQLAHDILHALRQGLLVRVCVSRTLGHRKAVGVELGRRRRGHSSPRCGGCLHSYPQGPIAQLGGRARLPGRTSLECRAGMARCLAQSGRPHRQKKEARHHHVLGLNTRAV